ncbi:Ig-like domain-containing protein [Roseisolibacter sp. H3M3-2]|uniref:Ig-like domain-containing protein n=1 Tax=Roseisolibacter sp. H3M3-2 TaxID=3031323 RepID=UPI0023DC3107|nr:Ig-like domain-containing protein [Roseisolibacter sp. H3M3-2]MDF1504266.1 Ig-like domain-containing protein [Roseisolibacter sp. H3M3-2]
MPRSVFTALAACAVVSLAACGGSDSATAPVVTPPGNQNPGTGNPGTGNPGTPAAVASVAITPAGGTVLVGRTLQLAAAARDANGATLSGRAVAWTSSADSVARVDANGLVTGVAAGSATITATSEGKSATASVAVQLAPVASIAVTPATANLRTGDTLRLAAAVRDESGAALAGRQVRWASSAAGVVTVDSVSGLLRATGQGNATITASSEGKTGTAQIAVVAPVATVAVNAALDTLEAWDVVQLSATLRDGANNVLSNRVVRWASSNPAVATVDSVSGQLTGLDRGTVTVTATSEGKSGTASRVVVIKYRSISAGTEHACDIASGGIVWCWGRNGIQLRVGMTDGADRSFSSTPVRLNTDVRFKQISTFGTTTCGVSREGKAYCWGYNGWGNLGNGTSSVPSATPVAVAGGLTVKSVSLGAQHNCLVTTDDKAYCWGFNQQSEFGNNTTTSSNVPVLAASGMSLASISGGNDVTCGVTAAGAGYCWGHNGAGQLGDGNRPTNGNTYTRTPSAVVGGLTFRSLHASQSYTCGLTTSGQGYCWGSGGARFGSGFSAETSTPRAIPGFTWKQLSPGARQACGITTDDDLYCWGSNGFGQLGNPVGANGTTTPVRAGGSLKAAEVSAANVATGSAGFTCTISQDRLTTYCFGKNDFGQLGNGATTAADASTATPQIVVGQKPLPSTR